MRVIVESAVHVAPLITVLWQYLDYIYDSHGNFPAN